MSGPDEANLNDLERALAGLVPRPAGFNRDRLMFDAGRAVETVVKLRPMGPALLGEERDFGTSFIDLDSGDQPMTDGAGNWVFDDFNTADAIDWCWDEAATDVLSNSWGGGPPVDVISTAFARARIGPFVTEAA